MSITDLEELSPLHHACGIIPKNIAKNNYSFNRLTPEEQEEAIKESTALKVYSLLETNPLT